MIFLYEEILQCIDSHFLNTKQYNKNTAVIRRFEQ